MNIKEKTYNVTLKGTKNYNSVSVTEGVTVFIDDNYNEFEFETYKQQLKDRLKKETRDLSDSWNNDMDIDLSIEEK